MEISVSAGILMKGLSVSLRRGSVIACSNSLKALGLSR